MRLPVSSRILSAFGLLVALASLGCSEEHAAEGALELPLVALQTVTLVDLEDRITAVGELVATHHTRIAAEVDGRVTELLLTEGEFVRAGQPLIELDPAKRRLKFSSAQAQVSEAAASVDNVERQLARQRELFGRKITSQSTLDDAETALRLAQAKLEAAEANLGVEARALEESTVRAPFDGLVVERIVSLGEYVKLGEPLAELVSLHPIDVEFRVAEIDSGFVHSGQDVEVQVAPYPDRSFKATVTMVSPIIDPKTRTLRVKAALDNTQGLLRPGLFARADLGLSIHKDVALVPSSAVLQRVDGPVVFVLAEEDHVERRVVELGSFREGEIEVISGLAAGDQILVNGQADLLDGQKVRIFSGLADPSR
jgi:RND family efflux transporter MFP subunit